jgi:hypothetical protein
MTFAYLFLLHSNPAPEYKQLNYEQIVLFLSLILVNDIYLLTVLLVFYFIIVNTQGNQQRGGHDC